MERAKLLEALQFEAQFQAIKQQCNDNRLLEVSLKEMKIPVEYMPAIQTLLNGQEAELCSRMMFFFKATLDKVVFSFVINNPRVNGYANDVVQMLRRNLVNNPEGNLTNQLANDTEEVAGHLANLKVKVEEADQDSTETVTRLNSSNDHHQSQSSAHTKDKAKNKKKKLSPDNHSVRGRKATNASAAAEPATMKGTCPESRNNEECNKVDVPGSSLAVTKPKSDFITDKSAKPVNSQHKTLLNRMRKRLYNLGRCACMVKGCSQTFVSTNINIKIEDHIKKNHHNRDKGLPCAKCPERFLKYDRLMEHYLMQHLGHYKCSVANCGFTSDVRAQVTNHYCEHDDHTEEGEAINQGSTVQSPLASECVAKEPSPVVAPSTSSQPSTMKRSSPEPRNNNEQCHQVDDQGQSSASAKKAKLDSTRSNNAQSQTTTSETVKHNSTEETQQNEMFIIVGLKCCLLDCKETFPTEAEHNHHMWIEHSISAFPCMIWGCGRSFNNRRIREDHVMKDHPNLNMWRYANCPKRFEGHWSLYRHYSSEHRHQYQCTLANCAFTSENRDIISRHYVREHDNTTKP